MRDGGELNQLDYLSGEGVLDSIDPSVASSIPDYRDTELSLAERGRAYLDINCAHCHNPGGWDEATERDFDFRYDTPFGDTGLAFDAQRVSRALERGEMPFLGTTMPHAEGIELVLAYLESL
jgi:hypothetical protein